MREEILRRLARRPIPLSPSKLATTQHGGEWPSPHTGKGLDFRSHRPYELGDDLRKVHMPTSIRAGERMIVERIALKDVSFMVILDCTPSMGVRQKADILLATSLMLLYSAVTLEMRVGAALVDKNGEYYRLGLGMGMRHASRLFTAIEAICSDLKQRKPTLSVFPRVNVHRLQPVSSMLLYVSDFLDRNGNAHQFSGYTAEAKRYDFIPVVIQDEFEYTFPVSMDNTLLELLNPETGSVNHIWLGNEEKQMLKKLNEDRFMQLGNAFSRRGIRTIHIDTLDIEKIHRTMSRFFESR